MNKVLISIMAAIGVFGLSAEARERLKVNSEVSAACNGQVDVRDLFEELPAALRECNTMIDNVEGFQSIAIWKSLCEQMSAQKIDLIMPLRMNISKAKGIPESWVQRRLSDILPQGVPASETQILRLGPINEICETGESFEISVFNSDRRGSFSMELKVGSQRRWINGQYKIYAQIPVARRSLASKEKASSGDFDFKRADITLHKDIPLSEKELQGTAFRHGLAFGQTPYRSDLYREPLIQRGQLVRLRLASNTLEISGQVQAEQVGYLNDIVKVKNIESQRVLSAKVIEPGVVEIQ